MINHSTLTITPEILKLIADIDEFKGAWRALGTLAPERLNALRHVASIESIGSSTRIEGSQLSDAEVEKFLQNLDLHSFDTRDTQEVAGYAQVMETIFNAFDAISITENTIKQLHRDLLKYSDKDARHRGEYKKFPNNISAFDGSGKQIGVIFETVSPFDTPQFMAELILWYQDMQSGFNSHPLISIGLFVAIFLEIHPFQDGNGRLSRVLTTLLLLKSGYQYVPYSSLESIIENNKENYYKTLRETQKTIRDENPNWQPWLLFFLRSLQKQKQHLDVKIEREKVLIDQLPDLSLRLIDHIKSHGRATMSELIRVTGANRNTLKEHLKKLVHRRHLVLHGKGKGAWYSL